MEGMVVNYTWNYKRINPRQFGNCSCKWKSLPKWTGHILVVIWWLYTWLAYLQTNWGTY